MQENTNLLPCPFCGCANIAIDRRPIRVRCTNCEAENPPIWDTDRAKKEWNMEPQTGSKYVFFDVMVRDRFGIQLYRQLNAGWSGYDVVDEEKFAWFLLKYSY